MKKNVKVLAAILALTMLSSCGVEDEITKAQLELMQSEMDSLKAEMSESLAEAEKETTTAEAETAAEAEATTTAAPTDTAPAPTTTTAAPTTTAPAPTTTTAAPTTTTPAPTTTTAAPTTTTPAPTTTTAAVTTVAQTYTVKFMSGGKTLSTQEVSAGAAAKPPSAKEVMEKTRLVFLGWDSDFDNITQDTTIYAELDTFKLEFIEHSISGDTLTCRWRCNSMAYYEMYEKKDNLILDRAKISGGSFGFHTQSSDTESDGSGTISATAAINGRPSITIDGKSVLN